MEIPNDFKAMTESRLEDAKLRADQIAQKLIVRGTVGADEYLIHELVNHIEAQSKRYVTLGMIRATYETVLDEARAGKIHTVKGVMERADASVQLAIQKAAAL